MVKGSLQKQLIALALLKERGFRVFLKCVVTRLAESELLEIKALADRFDYPIYFDPVLTISDDRQLYPLELRASDEGIANMYRSSGLNIGNSPFEREPGEFNCSVGTGNLHVTPFGDLPPCVQWKEPMATSAMFQSGKYGTHPSIARRRGSEHQSAQAIRESIPEYAFCSHCPGLSHLRTGDPLRPDEQHAGRPNTLPRGTESAGGT